MNRTFILAIVLFNSFELIALQLDAMNRYFHHGQEKYFSLESDSVVQPESPQKKFQKNGFAIGFIYGNYFNNSETQQAFAVIQDIHMQLFSFGLKWRRSLFETKFSLGFGNDKELRLYDQPSHVPPSYTITIEEEIDRSLFQSNLQVRLFVSNQWRITPYLWIGYSFNIPENTQYPNVSAYHIGLGLHYHLTKNLSVEGSIARAVWDEVGAYYDYNDAIGVTYFEFGIYKTIFSKQ